MPVFHYHLIIGSNLGDRLHQIGLAKTLIRKDVGPLIKESDIYETQPWGYEDQPWFLNQVVEVHSHLSPEELIILLKQIEVKCGRQPGEKWHARHLDLDILLCGDLIVHSANLTIPHKLMHERNFVLIPLMEIAPEFVHPEFGKTIEELYAECRVTGEVYIFNADERGDPL